jgi:hypothetical protein
MFPIDASNSNNFSLILIQNKQITLQKFIHLHMYRYSNSFLKTLKFYRKGDFTPKLYRCISKQTTDETLYKLWFLNSIFDEHFHHQIPQEERELFEYHNSSATYGCTNDIFVHEMVNACNMSENDVFVDLGSGLGKVVLQVSLIANPKRAIGIELSGTRVDMSHEILESLNEEGMNLNAEFISDTFLNPKTWNDATIVFSWCYRFKHLLPDIAKIAKDCDTLKYIALHDGTFEEVGLDLKEYNLERVHEFHDEFCGGNICKSLYIYKKI